VVGIRDFESVKYADLELLFAKTSAEPETERFFGGVVMNTTINSMLQEGFEEGEPECAWSTHIYKDQPKVDPN
jgi:hypothetical protein